MLLLWRSKSKTKETCYSRCTANSAVRHPLPACPKFRGWATGAARSLVAPPPPTIRPCLPKLDPTPDPLV